MKQTPSFARWMDEDKVQLQSVMSDNINIMDTQCGHLAPLQERELEAALEGMSHEKKGCNREEIVQNVDGFETTMAKQKNDKNSTLDRMVVHWVAGGFRQNRARLSSSPVWG
jgi:hypothetical protein